MSKIRSFASNSLCRLARTILYGSNESKPISSRFSERLDSGTANPRMQYAADADKGTQHNNEHSKTRENNFQPPAPFPPKRSFPTWARWTFGSMLSLFLPLWKSKWGKLLMLEDEVEKAAQVVETTAELVEMVADAAETLSNEVAQKLPEDGKLKDAVLFVEHVSMAAEKDAQRTIEFVRKVNELKQEVESLVEPVFHQLKNEEKEAKDK